MPLAREGSRAQVQLLEYCFAWKRLSLGPFGASGSVPSAVHVRVRLDPYDPTMWTRGNVRLVALLLVVAALAGCGDSEESTTGIADLDARYQCAMSNATTVTTLPVPFHMVREDGGEPSEAEIDETVGILCRRADVLGAGLVSAAPLGADKLRLTFTELPFEGQSRAFPITAPGHLGVYDWEANVIGAPEAKEPALQPFPTRADAEALAMANPDSVVVRETGFGATGGYFVLRDNPALTNEEIESAEAATLPPFPGEPEGQPAVALTFTEDGQEKFQALTSEVAQRGRDAAPASAQENAARASAFSDHFAIVVDGALLSMPIVNFVDNPQGIDPSNGAEFGGGLSSSDAGAIAALILDGPLPVQLEGRLE